MAESAYVYILASKGKRLYIGVTTHLERRIREHKNKVHPDSLAARYNIDQLVYFEQYASPHTAIAREKQLKGWLRVRKIALIVATNPGWRDLSRNWGKPLPPLQSADRPCPTHQPQTQVILSAAKDLSIPDAITFP